MGIDRADELRDWYAEDDEGNVQPAAVHRGQARFAYRMADRYADKLLYVTGIGWHRWDGTRFVPDDRGAATRAVLADQRRALAESAGGDMDLRRDVRKIESAAGVAGVLTLAAALQPLSATVSDIDADPYTLNVANGTLDLHTGNLRPHNPADRITKVCRGAYKPDAQSALWDAFLARVLPDEAVRQFVQRLIGASLLGAVREHVLAILTGKGANGKGTFYKAVCATLGDYASTAEPDLFMHRTGAHPTGEMDLLGRRLVVVSESERDRQMAEATMKRLTGGDTIRARRMRQDFVEFTPSHTALLVTNHLPKVSGDDPAIWRRIRVVPFDVSIPQEEQDADLDDRLALEADAILGWAVAGWWDYLDRGLDAPDAVLQATATYQQDSDAVARFIADCCHTGPAVKATTAQLFDAWQKWRAGDDGPELTSRAFAKALTDKGYPAPASAVNGKRWRTGIGLRSRNDDTQPDSDGTETAPKAPNDCLPPVRKETETNGCVGAEGANRRSDGEPDDWAPLGVKLPPEPERCAVCGFHPPTQGHRDGCTATVASDAGTQLGLADSGDGDEDIDW
jgi:putative DNA primase/helicase